MNYPITYRHLSILIITTVVVFMLLRWIGITPDYLIKDSARYCEDKMCYEHTIYSWNKDGS